MSHDHLHFGRVSETGRGARKLRSRRNQEADWRLLGWGGGGFGVQLCPQQHYQPAPNLGPFVRHEEVLAATSRTQGKE